MTASGLLPWTKLTVVIPRSLRTGRRETSCGPGDGAVPGAAGERRRHRGVERDVALDLLHDLVDVTVEHGHRPEPREVGEGLRTVLGPPPPFG